MAAPRQERERQRLRTRRDLLRAAARLMKQGRKPTLEEVAEEALVSRATAYRYFPSVEALLVEAPVDETVPSPEAVFAGDRSTDPAARADAAEAVLHDVVHANEVALRVMLASRLQQRAAGASRDVPVRQNRRTPLIEAALAPARDRFTDSIYRRLCASLALVFGTESFVVFEDVLGVDRDAARATKSWAIRALVAAALDESAAVRRARAAARRVR